MRSIQVFAVLLGSMIVLGAGDAPIEPPTPASQSAERRYRSTVEKAQAEYFREVIAADKLRISELQAALNASLNSKNVKVAEAIDALKSDAESALQEHMAGRGELQAAFAGKWHVTYTEGGSRDYIALPDGTIQFPAEHHSARLVRGIVDFKDGKLERWTPAGAMILVEHFDPASGIHSGKVAHLGVAVRVP
jgi:hypothetical protein